MSLFYIAVFIVGGSAAVGSAWLGKRHAQQQDTKQAHPMAAPKLRIASTLEAHDERRLFTLSVWNDGDALAIADAEITKLEGGLQHHDEEMPIRLGFIGKAHLPPGDRGRIVVVDVDRDADRLKFGPGGYRHLHIHNARGDIIGATFCVRVDFLNTSQAAVRAFRLIPDDTKPLLYHAESADDVSCPSVTGARQVSETAASPRQEA